MGILDSTQYGTDLEEQTVGAVVAANYRTAEVFTRYGIDYCCGGQKTISQACAEKGLSAKLLLQEAALVAESGGPSQYYDQWALDFLADYIVNQHHAYTKNMIPRLSTMVEAVVAAHGEDHPEIHPIETIWQAISGELIMHMQKEELMLFPYIKRLVRGEQEDGSRSPPRFGATADLIRTMEDEHQSTGDQLAALAELSNGFTPPVNACNTFRALYAYLEEFQEKTKEHVHLENNILFPKAIALEAKQLKR